MPLLLDDSFSPQSKVFKLTEGSYKFNSKKKSFSINGIEVLILKRKKLNGKPAFYLLAKTKPKDSYVSSLYPIGTDNQFRIDYSYVEYILTINKSVVNISKL